MGTPIFVGWLAGNVPAGMMAATGGFTALYGSGRPYLSRARELAVIAQAFALCVGIGLAWCVHMAGALVAPRGPEQRAVVRAGDAVVAYVQAIGTPRQDAARHQAAQALYRPGPLWSPTSPWTHGRADA